MASSVTVVSSVDEISANVVLLVVNVLVGRGVVVVVVVVVVLSVVVEVVVGLVVGIRVVDSTCLVGFG